jgi:outer membrane protein assembly factor BamE (lipoprotein component of BamABCDE complex)
MFSKFKKHFIYLIFLFILSSCKVQEPLKMHGIIYLENRANKLTVSKTNKNDIIRIFGQPQIITNDDRLTWIYLERILTKGKYHKLGRHVIKENNLLVLKFDKFGILESKKFLDKDDIKKVNFSEKITENELGQKSFVETFLQSVKQKMYSNRK